jgi:hypothetical protein
MSRTGSGWLEQIKAVSRMRLASAVFMVRVIREKASVGRWLTGMEGVGVAGTRRMQRKAGIEWPARPSGRQARL